MSIKVGDYVCYTKAQSQSLEKAAKKGKVGGTRKKRKKGVKKGKGRR